MFSGRRSTGSMYGIERPSLTNHNSAGFPHAAKQIVANSRQHQARRRPVDGTIVVYNTR